MKLKEIIVVEGKDDTVAIKRAIDADTIETNGSAIDEKTIEQIQLAAKVRGVIIFTDPDFPGEKIRKTISERVPNCKHAFLPKQLAKEKNGKKIGVEHASPEHIRFALRKARKMEEVQEEQISREDLINYGFIGQRKSKDRRDRLGELLKIGHTNGKQLYNRLNMFQISRDDFIKAAEQIIQEEQSNG